MNLNELKYLQALPLELKIAKTKLRIEEAVYMFGIDGLYTSVSGGKDSTVLHHLVKSIYPNIPSVGCDTGLEYPEVKDNMYKLCDEIIKPSIPFTKVIEKYGYPCISKEQSQFIYQYKNAKSEKTKATRWNGNKWGMGKISEKWKYLVEADFNISDKCCDEMKKKPFKKYEKETNRIPIIGKMACESKKREQDYIKQGGCNAFDNKRCKSEPIGFWTEQDILEYIKLYNLEIPSVYGDIVECNGKLKTTKCDRTGCVFCLYGIHMDSSPNRIQRLSTTHPKLYDYCLKGGKYNDDNIWIPDKGLGMKHVLETLDINYHTQISLFDEEV